MGEKRGMKALEAWCRKVTGGYRDVRVHNMTTSWRDGLAFCAIIHHFQPDLIDFDSLSKENIYQNNNLAFSVAEQRLGIPALLDAEDMVQCEVPDRLSILTYVSQLYRHFHGMEATTTSEKSLPAKRPLDDSGDATTTPAESPGKRSAVRVPSPSPPPPPTTTTTTTTAVRLNDACHACGRRVYILERLIVDNRLYHRTCFRCCECDSVLRPGAYIEGRLADRYECVRCPREEEAPERRPPPARVSLRVVPETVPGPRPPPASKPLEIASAAAEARHVFHARILASTGVDLTPVTDTGQTAAADAVRGEPDATSPAKDPDATPVVPRPSSPVDGPIPERGQEGPAAVERNGAAEEKSPVTDLASSVDVSIPDDDPRDVLLSPPPPPSSDERNNNVEPQPPTEKPPPPPLGSADGHEAEVGPPRKMGSKPAIPQKPNVIPERPASLRIRAASASDAGDRPRSTTPSAGDDEPPSPAVPDFRDVPKPVAAPRSNRTGRPREPPSILVDGTPVAVRLSPEKPTPKRRSEAAPTDREPPPPPKPPRRLASPRRVSSPPPKTLVYPEDLNPFGDDDEDDAEKEDPSTSCPNVVPGHGKSLNPFGDSDDDDDDDDDDGSETAATTPVVPSPGRRLIPCDRLRLDPFASDGDSEVEERISNDGGSGVATVAGSGRSRLTEGGIRKKRPAPLPPSSAGTGSETSSPRMTPRTSPRFRRHSPAPPRPTSSPRPPRRSSVPPGPSATAAPRASTPVPSPSDGHASDSTTDDSFVTEKTLKELDNLNRSKMGRRGSPLGADVSSDANTFARWKRKKRPAPLLPVPRRRQIRQIPAKEIQSELLEIEEKQAELEKQGVDIEKLIRDKFQDDVDPSDEEEDLILQLFELVNKKNALFRRQTELIYLKRQQRLEEEHADLEFQIRCLMEKTEEKKTDEDRALEERLIARLVDVVTQRSEIVESMEMDRLREEQEDRSIREQLSVRQGASESSADPSARSVRAKNKDKNKKKKKKKSKGDEDKDADETESSVGSVRNKDKKKKWLFG